MAKALLSPILLLLRGQGTDEGKAFVAHVGSEWARLELRCIMTLRIEGMINMRIFAGVTTLAEAAAAGLGSWAVGLASMVPDIARLVETIATAFPNMTEYRRSLVSDFVVNSVSIGSLSEGGNIPAAKLFPTNRSLDPNTQAYRFHVKVTWIDANETDPSRMVRDAVIPVDFADRPRTRQDVLDAAAAAIEGMIAQNTSHYIEHGLNISTSGYEIISAERAGR